MRFRFKHRQRKRSTVSAIKGKQTKMKQKKLGRSTINRR